MIWGRKLGGAVLVLAALGISSVPAWAGNSKDDTYVKGIEPAYVKKWSFDDWNLWATTRGTCLALEQETLGYSAYHVWGFEQSPGSRVMMYFGSDENAQPQTVQMSWNMGGDFDYDAQVIEFMDWKVYTISLQANALSVFPRQLNVAAKVNGKVVFINVYNSMDRLRKAMTECLAYVEAN